MRAARGFVILMTAALLPAAHDVATAGDAPRAVDVIEHDLVADDPAVRAKAAAELTDRFPDGAVSVPMLVDLLDDEDKAVASAAAHALQAHGVAAATAIEKFVAAESPPPDAILFPAAELKSLFTLRRPRSLEVSLMGLKGREPTTSCKSGPLIAGALWPDDTTGKLPFLADVLRARKGAEAAVAAAALGVEGAERAWRGGFPPLEAAQKCVKDAVALVKSARFDRAWAGARLLDKLGTVDADAALALVDRLVHCEDAAYDRGPDQIGVELVVRGTLAALRTSGAAGKSAAPALIRRGVYPDTARALIAMGCADDVVKAFAATKKDQVFGLAVALAEGNVAPQAVAPPLIAALDTDWQSRDAGRGLFSLGPSAASFLPAVRKKLEFLPMISQPWVCGFVLRNAPADADSLARLDALASGKAWPPDDPNSEYSHPDGETTRDAAIVLRRLAPNATGAGRALTHALGAAAGRGSGEVDWYVVESASEGIAACGSPPRDATAVLVRLADLWSKRDVKDWDPRSSYNVPRAIARALGRIGPDAAAAVPLLTALRDGKDETVRVPAAQSLRRIRAKK